MIKMAKDYYEILGVNRNATRDEIKKAYKNLAKKYHPDVNKDQPKSADKFKEVSEAASILGDDKKREQYDQYGEAAFQGGGSGGADFSNMGGFSANFDFGDLFESFFGGSNPFGGSRRPRKRRGSNLRYEMEIELEDAVLGAEKHVVIERYENCSKCDGSGARSQADIKTCSTCNGSGSIRKTQRTPFGLFQTTGACSTCHGQGNEIKEFCPVCDGAGRILKNRKIKVEVPAGVETGNTLRLSGEGEAGETGAGSGDLFVVLVVKEHKIFERRGNNLLVEVPISFVGAVLGDSIKVPTIKGSAKLKIPPGTQSNTLFKMKEKGVPFLNSSSVGDQYVQIVVHTPDTKLNTKQKNALKKFGDLMGDKITPKESIFDKLKKTFS